MALNLGASLGSTSFHIMKSPHVVACSCTKGKLQHLCVICFERRFGKKHVRLLLQWYYDIFKLNTTNAIKLNQNQPNELYQCQSLVFLAQHFASKPVFIFLNEEFLTTNHVPQIVNFGVGWDNNFFKVLPVSTLGHNIWLELLGQILRKINTWICSFHFFQYNLTTFTFYQLWQRNVPLKWE